LSENDRTPPPDTGPVSPRPQGALDTAPDESLVGTTLGHYRIVGRLGAGGYLLHTAFRAGAVSPAELEAQLGAWRKDWVTRFTDKPPAMMWVVDQATMAGTREEAMAALATRPPVDTLPDDAPRAMRSGHVSLLADRNEEAETLLETAAKNCMVLESPFVAVRAQYELGLAREALGHKDGACAAYGAVLARWGHATPRSVTAERARAHAAELGCSPPDASR